MKRLETARDTAYDNYVASLSPSEKPKEKSEAPVTYVEIKEYRVECRNSCGTIFSSKDVGLANLAETAEKAHLILCGSEPHKSKGVGYYSCPPNYVKVCPQSGEHWKESEQKLACRGGCGTLFPRLLGDIPADASHRTQTECGEKSWHSRSVRIEGQDLTEEYVDDCPQGTYYHCNDGKSCPNSGNHVGSDETVTEKYIDSNGNEVPKPATPLACGHAVGSEGIHLRVSC
ncbi:MAG: hypothetical protein OXI24_00380, partial [Candidatus Poribacteria bacterium]|nr:hypothetical protein [Candidatus Poribacteria bacterium]